MRLAVLALALSTTVLPASALSFVPYDKTPECSAAEEVILGELDKAGRQLYDQEYGYIYDLQSAQYGFISHEAVPYVEAKLTGFRETDYNEVSDVRSCRVNIETLRFVFDREEFKAMSDEIGELRRKAGENPPDVFDEEFQMIVDGSERLISLFRHFPINYTLSIADDGMLIVDFDE